MLERIRELFTEYVEVDPAGITADTNLRADLGLNSLEFVNLITRLEDEFGIEIPDRDAMGFQILGDVVEYLEKRHGAPK